MSVNTNNEQQETAQPAEPCPECAFEGPVEWVKNFDDSPLPPNETRTLDELCQIPFMSPIEPALCPRCGGQMPIRVIELNLHPACRHPDWRKRTGRGENGATAPPETRCDGAPES